MTLLDEFLKALPLFSQTQSQKVPSTPPVTAQVEDFLIKPGIPVLQEEHSVQVNVILQWEGV